MSEPSISVVIATIGRPTLRSTIDSIRCQRLIDGDEVLVAVDGPFPRAIEMTRQAGPPFRSVQTARRGYWGHGIRNWVFDHQAPGDPTRLRGDLVAAVDDDNVFTPWAFDAIRRAATSHPGCPLLFRVVMIDGTVIWQAPEVARDNVDTASVVVPRAPVGPGRFRLAYGGDYQYVASTIERHGGAVSFEADIICVSRPAPGLDLASFARPEQEHRHERIPGDDRRGPPDAALEARALGSGIQGGPDQGPEGAHRAAVRDQPRRPDRQGGGGDA